MDEGLIRVSCVDELQQLGLAHVGCSLLQCVVALPSALGTANSPLPSP